MKRKKEKKGGANRRATTRCRFGRGTHPPGLFASDRERKMWGIEEREGDVRRPCVGVSLNEGGGENRARSLTGGVGDYFTDYEEGVRTRGGRREKSGTLKKTSQSKKGKDRSSTSRELEPLLQYYQKRKTTCSRPIERRGTGSAGTRRGREVELNNKKRRKEIDTAWEKGLIRNASSRLSKRSKACRETRNREGGTGESLP